MKTAAVLGAGTMGPQIALLFSLAGHEVQLYNHRQPEQALPKISQYLKRYLRRNPLSPEEAKAVLQRISPVSDLAALGRSCIVVEAVIEDLKVKQTLFQKLDRLCPTDVVLASNTSSLSLSAISEGTKNPGRVLGMHFFNPALEMELVEVIATPQANPEVVQKAVELARAMKKTPLCLPESLVNRMLIPMINEACWALEQGLAAAEDVDRSLRLGAHHPVGPLTLADLIGIDVVVAILETFQGRWGEKYKPAPALTRLLEQGFLGRKVGRGFFSYGELKRTIPS